MCNRINPVLREINIFLEIAVDAVENDSLGDMIARLDAANVEYTSFDDEDDIVNNQIVRDVFRNYCLAWVSSKKWDIDKEVQRIFDID